MKFSHAIEMYVEDMVTQGRLNSRRSENSYRDALGAHADDVANRDPRFTSRDDVKRTLRRWSNPNTQAKQRSMLVSFYDWLMEEGLRKDNPARQTRRPKRRKPAVYRLTFDEARRFLTAAETQRERRVAFLGVCAGLRRDELRLLQGRHFAREGWVWVSPDIAKGGVERWVPVTADLVPVVQEIRRSCGPVDWVFPAQQFADPGWLGNVKPFDLARPTDGKTIWRVVKRIGKRAGLSEEMATHAMRRAFADHIARFGGVDLARALLGHSDLSTTQTYLQAPRLDDLAASVAGITFLGEESSPAEMVAQSREWRRWESNPRPQSVVAASGFLRHLFGSPLIREAARGL